MIALISAWQIFEEQGLVAVKHSFLNISTWQHSEPKCLMEQGGGSFSSPTKGPWSIELGNNIFTIMYANSFQLKYISTLFVGPGVADKQSINWLINALLR